MWTELKDFAYHFGPPLVVCLLTIWIGKRMKKGDELRLSARQQDVAQRNRIERMVANIQRQNAWSIRKFTELVAIHNSKHPELRIELDDYPNGYSEAGGD